MNRLLSIVLAAGLAAISSSAEFNLTIKNTGPQPLSPLFHSASTYQFNIFSEGGYASPGIKNIAETGNAASMLAIAASAPSSVGAYGLLGSSPLFSGMSRTTTFSASSLHSYFSFASMLGMTNDGFIGESVNSMGLKLFNGTTPNSFTIKIYGNRAWDAGTEKNTQNQVDLAALGGSLNPGEEPGFGTIRVHSGITAGLGDSWQELPNWTYGTQLAEIQVQSVPEPASMVALGVGACALLRRRARRS